MKEKAWKRSQSRWSRELKSGLRGRTTGESSVYVTPSAIVSHKQVTALKRAIVREKKNEKIEEVITCGKMKGVLSSFNIYSVNLKFVCLGSQRDCSNHVRMQSQLTEVSPNHGKSFSSVVWYCVTIKSVEWVKSCRDWGKYLDFYWCTTLLMIFIFSSSGYRSTWDIFRHLQSNNPGTCREVVLRGFAQTFNTSYPSLVENQDNRKDITHVSYFEHRRAGLKHVSHVLRLSISRDQHFLCDFY